MKSQIVLTKGTLIPIGVVVALMTGLIAISFFLSGLSNDRDETKLEFTTLKSRIEAVDLSAQNAFALNSAKIELIDKQQTAISVKLDNISETLDEIRKKLNIIP